MSGSFVSYAQNFEDVRLWRAFRDIDAGRYLDVGTQDPVRDSVSLAFYERGWRGVHVEPTPAYAAAIRSARPDEAVIEAAVSTAPGPIAFYEIPETGISTGIAEIAQRHSNAGWVSNRITVPTVTLADLFGLMGDEAIHWLKIDVEGMEADVLRSWGDHPARPAALVIEATAPNSTVQTHDAWYDLVLSRGYRDVLFDGLSRYFVYETHAERGAALALSPNVFDGFHVTLSHFSTAHLADERDRAVEAAVLQGEAERDAAVSADRHDLEARLSAAELGLSEERAAHIAQQDKTLALIREAGRLEGQLAAQADHSAIQSREAEAMRRELLDQLAQAGSERAAAQADVADLRVRIETLSGEHALALAKAQLEYRTAQASLAARKAEIGKLQTERAEREALWNAQRAEHAEAMQRFEARVAALHTNLDQAVERAESRAQLLATAASLLTEPADALGGWPRKVATVLARLAGRRPDHVAARHAAQVAAWQKALSPDAAVTPEWTELDLAPGDPVAAVSFGYKELQMFSDDGPITTVPRLLAPHDAEFIDTAYQAVLGRAPDPQGRAYYLARLRTGTHKLEILRQLRRSAEGRAFVPGVAGLDRAIRRFRLATAPVIGLVLRLFTNHDGDSRQERQFRMLVNELGRAHSVQASIYGATREIGARLDQINSGQQALLTAASTMAAGRVWTAEADGPDIGNAAMGGDASHQRVPDHRASVGNLVADYFARR